MNPHVAAMGFGVMMGERARVGAAVQDQPVFGFTAPTVIYDKQRQIDSEAKEIGPKVLTYASNEAALVDAWRRFDADWRPFFAKYAGDPHTVLPEGKIAALLYTDELAAQTNAFAERLDAIRNAYETLRTTNGQPLPSLNVPSVHPIPEPRPSGGLLDSFTLPWWVWTLGGVALVGAGYYLYRTYIGKPLEIARGIRGAHDPSDRPIRFVRQGSPELGYPQGIPLSVEDVAAHPMPVQHRVVYRPYQHPHVVAGRDRDPHVIAGSRDPQPFRSSLDGYKEPDAYETDRDEFDEEEGW